VKCVEEIQDLEGIIDDTFSEVSKVIDETVQKAIVEGAQEMKDYQEDCIKASQKFMEEHVLAISSKITDEAIQARKEEIEEEILKKRSEEEAAEAARLQAIVDRQKAVEDAAREAIKASKEKALEEARSVCSEFYDVEHLEYA
jgi:hypothetical protein